MARKVDKILSDGEPQVSILDGERLSTFKRVVGIPEKPENVRWLYFIWLCGMVGLNGEDPKQQYRLKETDDRTYFMLATRLFESHFTICVPKDANRVADARALRDEFALVESSFIDYSVLDTPGASMLEVMVALARRFDRDVMQTEDEIDRTKEWFWEMLKNSELDVFVDVIFNDADINHLRKMKGIIETINLRDYGEDGKGGFFPLKHPKSDQRKIELWYQMHAYFLENHIE